MKYYDKNKEPSYFKYWDANNLCGCLLLKKLPVNKSECVADTSEFDEDFIKKTKMKKVVKDILLNLMFNIKENYMNFIMIYRFYQKEQNLEKQKSL